MARRKAAKKPPVPVRRSMYSAQRRFVEWDTAMRLGIAGMVSVFVATVFFDVYFGDGVPNYPFAVYIGFIFGAILALVWKHWPWRNE